VGVDGQTWAEYATNLEANFQSLLAEAGALAAGDGGPSAGASLAFAGSGGVRFLDTLRDAGFRMVLDPAIGQKRFQFGRCSGADSAEDIQQVRPDVDVVPLAAHRQRIEDGCGLARVFVAEEQPGGYSRAMRRFVTGRTFAS